MVKQVPTLPGIQPGTSAFSQVVEANGFVFVAGQVGDDPATRTVAAGGLEAEVRAMFENLRRVLQAVGLDLPDVVKSTVYLTDIADFKTYDAIYREYFPSEPPTRATLAVASLVPPYRIEIEVIAAR